MAVTTLNQTVVTSRDGLGNVEFRLTSQLTVLREGDLPFTEIFVHSLVAAADPKQDKFLRLASVHDLASLPRGRDLALATSATTFLAASCSVTYADVATTASAKALLQSRINLLIADWITYSTQLLASENTALPTAADTVITAAQNAHKAARSTRVLKDAALAAANTALTAAQATASRASTDYTAAVARRDACQGVSASLTQLVGLYAAYKGSVNAFVAAGAGVLGVDTAFDAQYASALAAQTVETTSLSPLLTSVQTTVATNCAAELAAANAAATAKTTADAAVASAQTAQALAQAEATAAAAAEASALTAALVLCPDYDPTV